MTSETFRMENWPATATCVYCGGRVRDISLAVESPWWVTDDLLPWCPGPGPVTTRRRHAPLPDVAP